ncbi:hypothetical protein DNTS_009109 [Danionella cerebrum]|uniref:Uncharacterized protein n=1 Tax=Danionella cerebrum TaxID=2873325 RepID=A0A553QAP5_9TELE|nr:hypothetical protein DNTS_009109 [Danionella translucida]
MVVISTGVCSRADAICLQLQRFLRTSTLLVSTTTAQWNMLSGQLSLTDIVLLCLNSLTLRVGSVMLQSCLSRPQDVDSSELSKSSSYRSVERLCFPV